MDVEVDNIFNERDVIINKPKNAATLCAETEIYRYLPYHYFLQMVERRVNVFAHFSRWEDPYEAFVLRSELTSDSMLKDGRERNRLYSVFGRLYGQSWTLRGSESDVLWRAYCERGQGVRIKSTVGNLIAGIRRISKDGVDIDFVRVSKIQYCERERLYRRFNGCRRNVGINDVHFIDTLFIKRTEFKDEEEVRIVLAAGAGSPDDDGLCCDSSLLRVEIDPERFIKDVYVDPCMDNRLFDQIMCRVKNKSDIPVRKSDLYEWPYHVKPFRMIETLENRFWKKLQDSYSGVLQGKRLPDRRYWTVVSEKGCNMVFVFNSLYAHVELYIDTGDKNRNKEIFEQIETHRNVVEKKLSGVTEGVCWERLDDKQGSRICIEKKNVSICNEELWDEMVKWFVSTMQVFAPVVWNVAKGLGFVEGENCL